MDHKSIADDLQKWKYLFVGLCAAVAVGSCIATRAPDERREIERAFRSLPQVNDRFGEVYSMSSTMKPARVGWTGGVKSGYFVYDVRGRHLHTDVMVHWEKRTSGEPASITKVTTEGGQLVYETVAPPAVTGRTDQ